MRNVKEWKEEILKASESENKQSSKASFRGFKYEGEIFCTSPECFKSKFSDLDSDKIESLYWYHEMVNATERECSVCRNKFL